MLRIAVPNKGSLSENASAMLAESGYRVRSDPRDLVVADPANDVEFFYLRPRDIATYVGSGALDVGITGRDLLLDGQSQATEIEALGFGGSTFRFASVVGSGISSIEDVSGRRVATSYPTLVESFLADHGVTAGIIRLDGAVESAIRLGVADVVADVVSTGTTLRKAGLEVFGPVILESEAVLICNPVRKPQVDVLVQRLRGVIVARSYALIDYDCRRDLLDAAVQVTPGFESPTISQLADPEWVAVRSLVARTEINDIMDRLHAIGARAILVTPLHAARM